MLPIPSQAVKHGLILLMLIGLFFTGFGIGKTWSDRAARAEKAELLAESYRAQIELNLEFRRKEQALVAQRDAAIQRGEERAKQIQARLVTVERDRSRLRDQIAAYSRGTPEDSLATFRIRAETLGILLRQADERAERDARELEQLNSEKMILLESWPK